MDYLNKLFKQKYLKGIIKTENTYSMAFAIVLSVLALVNIPLNLTTSKYITSTPGLIVLLILALSMVVQRSRIVMVLGLFVLYKIYHEARDKMGVLVNSVVQESVFRKLSSEKQKEPLYQAYLNVPKTLEEEIVGDVVPMIHTMPKATKKIHGNFKPVLSETHGATLVSNL